MQLQLPSVPPLASPTLKSEGACAPPEYMAPVPMLLSTDELLSVFLETMLLLTWQLVKTSEQ